MSELRTITTLLTTDAAELSGRLVMKILEIDRLYSFPEENRRKASIEVCSVGNNVTALLLKLAHIVLHRSVMDVRRFVSLPAQSFLLRDVGPERERKSWSQLIQGATKAEDSAARRFVTSLCRPSRRTSAARCC